MSKWTKDSPTVDGYYWSRVDEDDEDPIIILVESWNIGLIASSCGSENLIPVDQLTREWLGPIAPAMADAHADKAASPVGALRIK